MNQIASDGASENVSAMKQLATLSAKEVFGDSHDEMLPQQKLIAFPHPARLHILIYIGGEMPHWVKNLPKQWKTPANLLVKET